MRRTLLHLSVPPPEPWEATKDGVTYTLALPWGVVRRGELLVVRKVTCDPDPPYPIDPDGYEWLNPPVVTVSGEGLGRIVRLDPAGALKMLVEQVVLWRL